LEVVVVKRAAFLPWSGALMLIACATRKGVTDSSVSREAPLAQETKVVNAPPIEQAPPTEQAPVADVPPTVEASPRASAATTTPLAPALPPPRTRKPPPQTERDCKACNGDWGVHGLSPKPSCNCRTTDGGKRCKDGAECEGLCTAADDPEREVVERGPPARGFFVGRCSTFMTIFGCYRPIDDGARARPVDLTEPPQMICAD
jgi:hypothetical protein